MTKLAKCLVALGLLLVLVLLVVFFLFIQPYMAAETAMPKDAALNITEQADGSLLLSWQGAEGADSYLMEIFYKNDKLLYTSRYVETQCVLPLVSARSDVTIRITSECDYKTALSSKTRLGSNPLELTLSLAAPTLTNTVYHVNLDNKTVTFNWTATEGDIYHVYYAINGGTITKLKDVDRGECDITFGSNGDIDVPRLEETVTFYFSADRITDEYSFYGRTYESVSLVRDDLLGTNLHLVYTEDGQNYYTLKWEETKGDHYEVQQKTSLSGQWETIAQYGIYDELEFSTGHLKPFTTYYLRVVAYGEETIEGTEFSAYPAEVRFTTKESTTFCTVWPLVKLDIYADKDKSEIVGSAPAGKAYCVAAEENGLFKIAIGKSYGYIDSNYCMINLPDYIGGLCSYDITNSYSAIYMVHDYGIPEITGTVITGYEEVLTNTGYLVPFLYPTAQKLVTAALAVKADGYRLKLYDTFRPYEATRFLYDQTESIINDPIPEDVFANMAVVPWLTEETEGTEETTEPAPEPETEENPGEAPAEGEGEEQETPEEPQRETYYQVMTNGVYSLGAFLARNGSMHNLGIAVDLTLETYTSHTELEMQTAIHDLSWNAVVGKNNANANMLADYMTAAGFGTLSSEWWHFQDNDIKKELNLSSLTNGVSVEGWKVDDTGLRYRRADGTYYADGTFTIDGKKYTFDVSGYLED